MKRLAVMFAFAVLSVVATKSASASVIWKGTFESGDLSRWTKVERVAADRLEVVKNPAGKGNVLKVKVVQGDKPINASGNRNELVYTGDSVKEGDERFYEWSTMWPQGYVSPATWQLFTQFHHTGLNGSPPVELYSLGDQIYLRVSGEVVWSAPLDRGQWHKFMLHVVWSSKKSQGFVELFEDGKMALPKTYAATLFAGQGVYLKQGLYRKETIADQQTLYHTGVVIATSQKDLSSAYDASASESWGDMSKAEASGGCSTSGLGLAWPGLAAGLFFLAQRFRRQRATSRS